MKKIITLFFALLVINVFSFAVDLTVTGNFPDNSRNNANSAYKMTEI